MSLHARSQWSVPEETARIARAAFPRGNPYLHLREALGPLFTDADFADLFPTRGRGATSPACLALISVLQVAENLSDRQATEAVRSRLDWKYLLGLELEDPGFDHTLLGDFRARLLEGSAEIRLLEKILEQACAHDLLRKRDRHRTDSTWVLAAIRALNRLELVGETLRFVLNRLSRSAPEWVRRQVPAEWHLRYGARFEAARLPQSRAERQALALQIGHDGYQVLEWAAQAPESVRTHPVLEGLRRIWLQQYYLQEDQVCWRESGNVPPTEQQIRSPYDLEARYGTKGDRAWIGYKVHLSETCEAERPRLLTDVQTTSATEPDCQATAPVQAELASRALVPREHLVDSGYVNAEQLVRSQSAGIELLGPVAPDTNWQAQAQDGFALGDFSVDWQAHEVTCPRGKRSQRWSEPPGAAAGTGSIHVAFSPADCQACSARPQCTRGKARTLKLHPQAQQEALQAARQRQSSEVFAERYRARAGIEGTLSQGVRRCDLRRARYIGREKTHLQHVLTASAMNLARIAAWLQEQPVARTRISAFQRLMAA